MKDRATEIFEGRRLNEPPGAPVIELGDLFVLSARVARFGLQAARPGGRAAASDATGQQPLEPGRGVEPVNSSGTSRPDDERERQAPQNRRVAAEQEGTTPPPVRN